MGNLELTLFLGLNFDVQNPEFLTGRQAHIIYKGKKIGTFGIVHPEVATPLGIKLFKSHDHDLDNTHICLV